MIIWKESYIYTLFHKDHDGKVASWLDSQMKFCILWSSLLFCNIVIEVHVKHAAKVWWVNARVRMCKSKLINLGSEVG